MVPAQFPIQAAPAMTALRRFALIALTLALAALPAAWAADPVSALSPEQTAAVEKLIHDYLLNNPKVLTEAFDHAEQASKAEAETAAKAEIANRREELENDPKSPVLGNPKGDVTVVEFFDYRCPYCKASTSAVAQLLEQDKKIRLVLKDFPILGNESIFASRVALAVQKHGKYAEFYKAIFDLKTPVTQESTLEVVKSLGLNPDTIRKESESSEIDPLIKHNYDLAKAIRADGTPAFIIGDTMSPGLITLDVLKTQVAAVRAKAKS
jgi:protein-disulfide isomerase